MIARGARAVRAFRSRVGHRGLALLIAGIGWTLYGHNLRTSEPSFAMQRGLTVLDRMASLHVWAWLWLAGGLLALFGAVAAGMGWEYRPRREGAVPVSWDVAGFVGAVVPPATWSVAYLLSWWPLNEFDKGWNSAGVWGVPAGLAVIIASIPPTRRGGPR